MQHTAKGRFEVQRIAQPPFDVPAEWMIGRARLQKRFRGDLDACGVVDMLSAGTATKGSAVYVAIERVTGTLHGRVGTFVLHHTGVLDRGAPRLVVTVVPDSGTGALLGLWGQMTIDIVDGDHVYTFAYALPAT